MASAGCQRSLARTCGPPILTLEKPLEVCKRRGCDAEFGKKREAQRFCSERCREAYAYDVRRAELGVKTPRKRRLGTTPLGSTENGLFYSTKSIDCKHPRKVDLGAFVRAQQDQLNPIHFTTPEGIKGKVWLASDKNGNKLIGDDRHWRCHVPAAAKVDQEAKRVSASLADIWETELDRLRGFRVRLCIEGEKELQVLGCGWRIVTCQFRGDKVLLHHNGNTGTMKRSDAVLFQFV
jgi:hypothetical protein